MFTLRFVRAHGEYKAYSAVNYQVHRQTDGIAVVEMSRKLNGQDSFSEYVADGPNDYTVCYVTNLDGKTIDVIRQVEMTDADS